MQDTARLKKPGRVVLPGLRPECGPHFSIVRFSIPFSSNSVMYSSMRFVSSVKSSGSVSSRSCRAVQVPRPVCRRKLRPHSPRWPRVYRLPQRLWTGTHARTRWCIILQAQLGAVAKQLFLYVVVVGKAVLARASNSGPSCLYTPYPADAGTPLDESSIFIAQTPQSARCAYVLYHTVKRNSTQIVLLSNQNAALCRLRRNTALQNRAPMSHFGFQACRVRQFYAQKLP